MKKLKVEDALGCRLLHDITEVNKSNNFKGIAFKKGHIIKKQDIDKFKSIGKQYVFIAEPGDDKLIHEDDAALKLAPLISGKNIYFDSGPKEGKINFYSKINGVLKIDKNKIIDINLLKIPSISTIHNNFPVKQDKLVAGFRIIPLMCEPKIIDTCINILSSPAISVLPYKIKKASIIVTGNEVFSGDIHDEFIPLLQKKLSCFNVDIICKKILPDNRQRIKDTIIEFADKSEIIFITGGTSVDPDDVTKEAMRDSGISFICKGSPIQPGNNLSIGYIADKPVVAIPAAAIYFQNTSLDIFLPRILAGDKITEREIAEHGIGGLCHFCKNCIYPVCPFGKKD